VCVSRLLLLLLLLRRKVVSKIVPHGVHACVCDSPPPLGTLMVVHHGGFCA
jgi:hypothetical protein